MLYSTDEILQTLRNAREQSGLSQRDLSARIGVPQSHISKIESGGTDLRLSSLVELARALDYELVVVPRKALAVVEAIVSNAYATLDGEDRQRSVVFHRAQAALARLNRDHPDAAEFGGLDQTLRELANFRLSKTDLEAIRAIAERLMKLPVGPRAISAIDLASRQLKSLRNRIAHALPDVPRQAYGLDDENEDA
ncbi:helix-turn-helix transcriptional regulator [Mesorhizobium sp. WSM4307]|uniref:helix-turn-helix domain-containing protein n=1 Tax=unclassified Mesorhizobium TaxID=325217 RepID=UPI000BAE7B73|nr:MULTISPECIES: helix-turn-helix transcriptional regulator [unclassified Mesorhizobium]PBB24383.1 transcriptional regulator [Mesorhizobium sp. WSM4304]PBB74649.1 transcriptional regulator [Mesorhizobium sp. WSM4308]TRC71657.1 helix-turn-helix transcriptional regulator [Mesorhizobium sp. WSM4315]TRC83461.1 helix-turn-helix transcriptional regulator [Mesorhizobium sp. WSM4307]